MIPDHRYFNYFVGILNTYVYGLLFCYQHVFNLFYFLLKYVTVWHIVLTILFSQMQSAGNLLQWDFIQLAVLCEYTLAL